MVVLPGADEEVCFYEEAYQHRRKKSIIYAALKSHRAANSNNWNI